VFRVRSGRIAEDDLLARLQRQGFQARPVDGLPSFYSVEAGPRPESHTFEHWSGMFYVQQASTGLAATVLAPEPGERVLDLCASPGGKATHLAELMRDSGCLVACEIDERRMPGLLGNFYRLCVPNVVVIAGDGRHLPTGAQFDRVLVDAPCTGEGTVRRRAGEVQNPSERFRAFVTASQRALLERAVRLTRPGGTVLYVTCTFAPEENEAVVTAVLERLPVELVPVELSVPHAPGLTSFEGARYDRRLEGAARIYPHHLDSGGLFLAKLRRLEGDVPAEANAWSHLPRVVSSDSRDEGEAQQLLAASIEAVLDRHGISPDALSAVDWTLRGDTAWMHTCREWPVESWEPNGWRVISMGVRAIELDTRGRPRATNDFLRYATRAVSSAIDLDERDLAGLLGGAALPSAEGARPGAVALRYAGEVVGRGAHRREGLVHEIPKARARDLARVFEARDRA
jgi:NOL1/NOP2/sun family putative RNA methylase